MYYSHNSPLEMLGATDVVEVVDSICKSPIKMGCCCIKQSIMAVMEFKWFFSLPACSLESGLLWYGRLLPTSTTCFTELVLVVKAKRRGKTNQ